MNTIVRNDVIEIAGPYCLVPATPRGRALHTLDWFMNGKPVLNDHDDPNLKVQDVRGR